MKIQDFLLNAVGGEYKARRKAVRAMLKRLIVDGRVVLSVRKDLK